MRKNVILLTIDALFYPRLGFAGYAPSPSPTIDGLLAESLTFTQAMTPASPTQMAMPAIHASSLPLDHGGYDRGVVDRETTLAEAFSRAGYRTASIHGPHVFNRINGYARGFDTFETLISPAGKIVHYAYGVANGLYAPLYAKGEISLDYCTEVFAPTLVESFYPHLRELCAERAAEMARGEPLSPLLHNWDMERLADLVALEERWVRRDPRGYVHRLLTQGLTLGARMKTVEQPNAPALPLELVQNAYRALQSPAPVKAQHPSSRYLFDRFVRWLDRTAGEEAPFFANLHVLDVHDANIFSYDVFEDQAGLLREEWDAAQELTGRIRAEGDPESGWPIYACAIAYVDRQVARLLAALEARGLRENTLLVLCADHGWHHGTPADRPWSVACFHEENLHVPLAFHGPGVEPRVDGGLCSLLDLAPTALELAGVEVPASFRGESLLRRRTPRPYVQMEGLGSGRCDFVLKPMQLGVRSATHKVLCEVPPPGRGEGPMLTGLYDLRADPMERRNLAGAPFPRELTWMLEVAARRALEIHAQLGLGAPAEPAAEPAEAGLELEEVLGRLVEKGYGPVALPAVEAAITSLVSRASADAGGFELADLLAELRASGRGEVAGWTEEVVEELTLHRQGGVAAALL